MFYVFGGTRIRSFRFCSSLPQRVSSKSRGCFGVDARTLALVSAVLASAVFVNRPMLDTELMRAITEHNLGAALAV